MAKKTLWVLLFILFPATVFPGPTVFSKAQLPSVTGYTDAANTWAQEQLFGGGLKFSSSFTPSANGEVGWDGSQFLFREGGTNKTLSNFLSGSISSMEVVYATGSGTVDSDPQFTWNSSTKTLSLGDGGTTKTFFSHVAGTVGVGENASSTTATMTSSGGDEIMLLETILTAGGSSGSKIAHRIIVSPGFTGGGSTIGMEIINGAVGLGVDPKLASDAYPEGNLGSYYKSEGSNSTGYNIGAYGAARNAVKNFSLVGKSLTSTNATHNIGVTGIGFNATTVNIGVLAGLNIGNNPSLTSAALLADNGSISAPVAVFRAAGTPKVQVDQSGNLLTDTIKPNTSGGAVAHISDGGVSVQASDLTEGLRIRAVHVNTTNSTTSVMTFDGSGATSSNIPSLANSTTHSYTVTVTARNTTSGVTAAMIVLKAVLERSSGGTVSLVQQAGQEYVYRSNVSLDASLAADNTNKGLNVNVTGLSSTNITWAAEVRETSI